MSTLEPLHDIESLEAVLQMSFRQPVLIFKHSRYCGASAAALDEVRTHVASAPPTFSYWMVTVQTDRPLSNAVSAQLGIRHETPQTILVSNGTSVWNASHFRITAEVLDGLVAKWAPSSTLPV